MTKTRIGKAKVRVVIHWYLQGSVLKGTVDSGCREVQTHLEVDSDDDPEKVRHVVRCAKKGCFAEQMIVRPTPLTSTIRINGAAFEL
jgi:uncharacterized OsmC-like protein